MRTYRAAYWIDEGEQHEVVLTTPEESHLSDAALLKIARAEAEKTGLQIEPGRLVVGDWTDQNMVETDDEILR